MTAWKPDWTITPEFARSLIEESGSVARVLEDIQAALMPLKQPNMFVTVACVRGGAGSDVECAVAGHLPILRARAGVVEEVTTPQFALGMFAEARFTSEYVECRSGDLLALLTDGLIEVFDTVVGALVASTLPLEGMVFRSKKTDFIDYSA